MINMLVVILSVRFRSCQNTMASTTMHCLALRVGAKPRYRYTDPGLLFKAVHLRSRSSRTIQTTMAVGSTAENFL